MTTQRADGFNRPDGLVLMVGTALHTKGGVSSVVNAWRDAGLFAGWQVRYVGSNGGKSPLGAVVAALRCYAECAWLLGTGRAQLVHVHHSSFVSFWRKAPVFLLAMLFRRPLVVSLHGGAFREFYRELPPPVQWWQRQIMRYACRYLVLTQGWAAWAQHAQPQARVTVLPNLVAHIPERPPAYPADSSEPLLLFLGRVEALKGVPELIEALAAAHARGARWHLALGGTGDTQATLQAAKGLGLPDGAVRCIGWVNQQQKDTLLRQCSAMVLPSHIENMPVVILEAFAYARPVVATRVGGIPDMIEDGQHGLLVQPRDVGDLANALVKLWALGSERRAAMGRAGRTQVELHYSAEVVLSTLDEVYTACLKRR